jgi:hypothetical protein
MIADMDGMEVQYYNLIGMHQSLIAAVFGRIMIAVTSGSTPPFWVFVLGLILFELVPAWTVFSALRTGWIRTGQGLWHRTINRDDDPIEFWFAIVGNCFLFALILLILISIAMGRIR